jgi:hypothetical protein
LEVIVPELQKIDINTDEFEAALLRLPQVLELLFKLIDSSVGTLHSVPQALGVIVRDDATLGTGNVRVFLKPSDTFLKFMAATEALERELSSAEVLSHV